MHSSKWDQSINEKGGAFTGTDDLVLGAKQSKVHGTSNASLINFICSCWTLSSG